ncbi:ABC transporter substrate-binding protein [Vibrio mangrovi]|uniref:ABC transporter substrate-binding protein n=1 Tax=Vibrio mangrovi TaxID=474394 RepID=A0A1Y6IU05_9VIBR|nr:ABC transporter substrate-binding protein [Vibrio mangrovi]MDW6004826.1 ABC transporter substrate-binding protein [Vibrio mangrovi]SMS01118.1 Histidine-binding periplasmic protein precursor [Vibrio mangrovi]
MKRITNLSLFLLALSAPFVQASEQPLVRLGVEPGYAPFEMKNPDGSLTGFDIDLGKEICKRIEAHCEWVESDFDGLIPSLKAKKIDAILSSMSITPQRQQEIDFTDKLYGTPARLVAEKGAALQPTTASLGGKRVGVFQGTTAETYAKEQWAAHGVDVVTYQNQDLVYADLVNGRLDAAFQDAVAASDGFLNRPVGEHFAFSGPEVNDEKYFGVGAGIGVRKTDQALKNKMNAALAEMLKDGTYDAIAKKYFNFDIYGK